MEDYSAIRCLLQNSRRQAGNHLKAIRETSPLTRERLKRELIAYVLAKFLLTEEDLSRADNFDALTELSLSKSMQVSPELVKEFDTAQSCDGATSAMAKKVLLFRSIEKALDIQLPATRSARIRSMDDFADMVWDTLIPDPVWQGRLSLSESK